ncbi:HD domain-containing protein [Dactylosporangium sucinum]|uniref:Peptidase n=1 Tax=Dactylosporangium sucinum TaxID=1424081 RepID=A0A917UFI9_9ACTN|nr:peptidase [Dactylosporangium sucinum]GGM83296.1 peptidase [Dactylosporangium sucinum]
MTVRFTRMKDGSREEYDYLDRQERIFNEGLPDRIIGALRELAVSFGGHRVTRLEHSLQAATRALRDGRDEEYVVMTLVHDVGDNLAPYTHSELVGALLRPFVRPQLTWIARHHGVFQQCYYANLPAAARNARDRFRDAPWFDDCAEFCELYDQESFDPRYEALTLEAFEPALRRVFAEPRYLQKEAMAG